MEISEKAAPKPEPITPEVASAIQKGESDSEPVARSVDEAIACFDAVSEEIYTRILERQKLRP